MPGQLVREAEHRLGVELRDTLLRDAQDLHRLLFIHAAGAERIPSDFSAELAARAEEPCKLVIVPGGHHRSAQHDGELQGIALRWLERNL